MKYRRNYGIAWTIVFALLCMLCACGGRASSGQDVSAQDGPGTDGGNAFSIQTPGPAAGSGGDLIPLSRETGKGTYTVGRDGENQLLCYVDYTLAQEVPLCGQPACAHDSDTCTALVERGKYAWVPQTGDGSTIFFVLNDFETSESEIWAADSNGGGRRLLVQRASGVHQYFPVAEDGSFLYCFYHFISEAEGRSPEDRLCLARVPLQGGGTENIFSWEDYGAGAYYQLLGISGREIAVYRYDLGDTEMVVPEDDSPEAIEAANEAQREKDRQKITDHSVLLVNVDTGTQRELDAWSTTFGSVGRSLLWESGRLYWCADKTFGPIHWLDMDGQSGELPTLPEKSNDEEATYALHQIVQGKLLADWYGFTTDAASRCAIDLSDHSAGSAGALKLQYVHATSERPIRIEGRGEDGLLVQYEETAEFLPGFYEDDGTPKTDLKITVRYGIISYEDYFANRPNYRPVDMPYGFNGFDGFSL